MIYRYALVLEDVLRAIRGEVRRARFRETGGPLVGYVTRDGALFITHAGSPGPRAQLALRSVLIDGVTAQDFCAKVHRESSGRLDYVGDWHRHVGLSLMPSRLDRDAIRQMAAFEHCPVRYPSSLVYRSFPEKYAVYVLNPLGELELVESSTIAKPERD